ncbi:hypothetical protein KSP40_PGU005625 [Platanthera guangdongensis]|uniref:Uncharacterized protein n=1 Tax=Platanthera guangdongensis TaxID=2320717 RepID=A0ABR2MWH9_9ASPA
MCRTGRAASTAQSETRKRMARAAQARGLCVAEGHACGAKLAQHLLHRQCGLRRTNGAARARGLHTPEATRAKHVVQSPRGRRPPLHGRTHAAARPPHDRRQHGPCMLHSLHRPLESDYSIHFDVALVVKYDCPAKDKEPDDEFVGEEIHQKQIQFSDDKQGIDEVVSLEKEIAFEAMEEDDSDLELPNLLFNEEEEDQEVKDFFPPRKTTPSSFSLSRHHDERFRCGEIQRLVLSCRCPREMKGGGGEEDLGDCTLDCCGLCLANFQDSAKLCFDPIGEARTVGHEKFLDFRPDGDEFALLAAGMHPSSMQF